MMIVALKAYTLRSLLDEEGAQLVEYVLLLMLITLVGLVAVRGYGIAVNSRMNNNSNSVTAALN